MLHLQSLHKQLASDWSNSAFVGETADLTIQLNAHAIGQADLINKLLDTNLEEIENTIYENRDK